MGASTIRQRGRPVAAPDADRPTEGLQVVVSSGSLFIELVSVAQPATWVVSTIVFLKWLIIDGDDLAALPGNMVKSFTQSMDGFKEARAATRRIKGRGPLVDDQASLT